MTTTTQNIEQILAALARMTVTELRARYLEVFGEATGSGNRQFMTKRIAWRIQAQAEGTLSERARQRAEELARDTDIRTTLPRPPKEAADALVHTANVPAPPASDHRLPMPGAILSRMYRGQQIDVKVLPKGFEYQGQIYRSLTAVARAVTGSHWNGYLFFGLNGAGRDE